MRSLTWKFLAAGDSLDDAFARSDAIHKELELAGITDRGTYWGSPAEFAALVDRVSGGDDQIRVYIRDEFPRLRSRFPGVLETQPSRGEGGRAGAVADLLGWRRRATVRVVKPLGVTFLSVVRTFMSRGSFEAADGLVADFRAEWAEARACDERWRARMVTVRGRIRMLEFVIVRTLGGTLAPLLRWLGPLVRR